MAVLQVLKGPSPGQKFTLDRARAVLGRHPDCDIVLDVGAVSRQHAQILVDGNDFFVEDLKSRNGTFVNGQLIQGRQLLQNDDRLKICDVLLTFRVDDSSRLAPAAPQEDSPAAPGAAPTAPASGMRLDGAAMVLDDEESGPATAMTTLEVKSSAVALRATSVNAEAKLKALLEITRSLSSAIALEQVLPKILDSLFRIFLQADRGFVVLREGDRLIPKASKHRREGVDDTIRISKTIVNQAMTSKEAILSADAATDSRFDSSQSIADFRIRSMMCVPLLNSEGEALGVIQIDTLDQRSPFQQDDLDMLASAASQASFAVENAQLHETSLKKQAMERDLHLAHQVQQGFLPHAAPETPGYEFFNFYEAANQVGGDYFDYVPLPGDRLAVVVADVSGKGMPAALLMAKLSAETRYALFTEAEPAKAVTRLNASFSAAGWEDRFVTFCLCVIDLTANTVTISNAGHMAPYFRTPNGEVRPVGEAETGVPLGVSGDFEYEQIVVPLEPGDSLTMFTDGFSEAMNMNDELYGMERIEQQMHAPAASIVELGQRILDEVKRFAGKRSQSDDMCLLCLGRSAV